MSTWKRGRRRLYKRGPATGLLLTAAVALALLGGCTVTFRPSDSQQNVSSPEHTAPTTAEAPGARQAYDGWGTVRLVAGGSLDGQAVDGVHYRLTVAPGQSVVGIVNVRTDNHMSASAVAPLGYTVTWGDRTQQPVLSVRSIGTGANEYGIRIAKTAPMEPGRYYIVISFRGEFSIGQVMSGTNWSYDNHSGNPVWYDGNDLGWDWSTAQFQQARQKGQVLQQQLGNGTTLMGWMPAAWIEVDVTSSQRASSAATGFATPVDYRVGGEPHSVAVADLNGDGVSDLVAANWRNGDDTVSVLLGSGDGTFGSQTKYATGVSPAQVAVGDVNNDGRLDIIAENDGPYPGSTGTVSVLLGNGDGTFQPQRRYRVGSNPVSVSVTDVNHDHNLDLITSNWNDGTVSVLLGLGNGTFEPQMVYRVGDRPGASTAVVDLNHDQNVDIVTANYGSNDVSVLLGNGDGTFRQEATFAAQDGPGNVVAADLNHDGNLDLVVTNQKSDGVSILLGNGDGTFQPERAYRTGREPHGVATADLNGDGNTDIVVAALADNSLSVLLGRGDGTFGSASTYQTGNRPVWVAVSDLNRDGRPDLVSANAGSNTLSVLLGN